MREIPLAINRGFIFPVEVGRVPLREMKLRFFRDRFDVAAKGEATQPRRLRIANEAERKPQIIVRLN